MKITNGYHREILEQIHAIAEGNPDRKSPPPGYLGNDHEIIGLSVPQKRALAKTWLKGHKDVTCEEFFSLLDSLYRGTSNEEKTLGGTLLEYGGTFRGQIDLERLGSWLDHLVGWQEIDTTCQSTFSPNEILGNREGWKKFLKNLGTSQNINKRRASLVFLVRSTREVADRWLGDLALDQIRRIISEKPVLITKAVSWLLRSMSEHYPLEVKYFLKENLDKLPKIVIREVEKKLQTGRKSG